MEDQYVKVHTNHSMIIFEIFMASEFKFNGPQSLWLTESIQSSNTRLFRMVYEGNVLPENYIIIKQQYSGFTFFNLPLF